MLPVRIGQGLEWGPEAETRRESTDGLAEGKGDGEGSFCCLGGTSLASKPRFTVTYPCFYPLLYTWMPGVRVQGGTRTWVVAVPTPWGFLAWQVSMAASLAQVFSTQRVFPAAYLALLARRVHVAVALVLTSGGGPSCRDKIFLSISCPGCYLWMGLSEQIRGTVKEEWLGHGHMSVSEPLKAQVLWTKISCSGLWREAEGSSWAGGEA